MIEKSPILVTGIARSGTSIIAKVIEHCGAFTGTINKIYENISIQDKMVKPYLISQNADPTGQYPLPDTNNLMIPSAWKTNVEKIISEQGYKSGSWVLKDTKMNLMWPVWNQAFPNAKWIIVRRKTPDIIQSCMKTGFMVGFDCSCSRDAIGVKTPEEGWLWWIHQQQKCFTEMTESGLNCKQVWPERMVNGDYEQMFEMSDWLGLKWNNEIMNIIDPLLWNSRQKERS